ncbi:MAG: hypothetical protein LBE92_08980 [Chryseobacterium sp.]|jgi:hypothetical protein|uniref:hypothetical protein n=1 Tax=Chryseobacterium sp. TaxID=1871047 RepID=UPI002824EA23|nr:hypothetical protein [Chryseobacterium sp.]MDR2236244.1 hypothetical protein [Chryseobacterium sp.]
MGKNYLLKIFAGVLVGFMVSCNNSDSDDFEPTSGNGGNNGNGTPPPARVLEKITLNNVVQEEYTVNAGKLVTGTFRDGNTNTFYTGTVTYNGDKISKIKFVGNLAGSTSYEFSISEDSKGNIYTATCTAVATTAANSYISDYIITYDQTGKLTKILEKKKYGGMYAYTNFVQTDFTYLGNNIFKGDCTRGVLTGTGDPDMATAKKTMYSFQNYDSKISPFSTLPKSFFMAWSLARPETFYKISPNNPTSVHIAPPLPAQATHTDLNYVYDANNYPVSDKDQKLKYTYRIL